MALPSESDASPSARIDGGRCRFPHQAPINLDDPELYANGDPWRAWRWLREHAPVYWNEQKDGAGFWALTRYDDIRAVYLDHSTFTSETGILLDTAKHGDPAGGKTLPLSDPPSHSRFRTALSYPFSAAGVNTLEPRIREITAGLIDTALEVQECDVVDAITARLPLAVMSKIIGIPAADLDDIAAWSMQVFGAPERDGRSTAHQQLLLYFMDLVSEGRKSPESLIASLLNATDDPLTEEEIVLNLNTLLIGGTENTRHAASAGVLAFIEHPREEARLRDYPGLTTHAVEEVLRWTSPSTHIMRRSVKSTRIGGTVIEKDAVVTLWNPSANRDEVVFAEPDVFDISRHPNRHLALGTGTHFCLGARLARVELRILLEELMSRTRAITQTGLAERLRSRDVLGITRLPVRLTAC